MLTTVPDIVRAAESRTVLQAALAYEQLGFSCLACNIDKSPAVRQWKHLSTRRASQETIKLWAHTGLLKSVGLILGDVSRGIVVIDCDGLDAVLEFAHAFPALTDTYKVESGSGKGAHFYLQVDDVPPTTRTVGQHFGNIELRSGGSYVIAPPSAHPSGMHYRVVQPFPIKRVTNLNAVRRWIEALIAEKHGGKMPPAANARAVVHTSAYARAALLIQADRVAAARIGARNMALNMAAFRMGRLVREGNISRADVESALEQAAQDLIETDGIASVRRTIESGLNAGIEKYER